MSQLFGQGNRYRRECYRTNLTYNLFKADSINYKRFVILATANKEVNIKSFMSI